MFDRQGAKNAKGLGLNEPSKSQDALARRVIGAAIEVHRTLGPGFLETIYEEAVAVEFELRGISFERQPGVDVTYKVRPIGMGRPDFIYETDCRPSSTSQMRHQDRAKARPYERPRPRHPRSSGLLSRSRVLFFVELGLESRTTVHP